MTRNELVEFSKEFFGKCHEIMESKNADYSGAQDDPFANFKAIEIYGIATEVGFLTRMTDKMARLASFIKRGELLVKDESVTDTLRDLANYSMLLAAYLEDNKGDAWDKFMAMTSSLNTQENAKTNS